MYDIGLRDEPGRMGRLRLGGGGSRDGLWFAGRVVVRGTIWGWRDALGFAEWLGKGLVAGF